MCVYSGTFSGTFSSVWKGEGDYYIGVDGVYNNDDNNILFLHKLLV